MKKYFSFIVAVATMFSVASCSQEEVVGNATGNEVEVTFNATMEGQAVSRAIGDGLTVDQLIFAVFDKDGNEVPGLRQNDVQVSKKGAVVTTHLVKGQTYQFVFWAQKSGESHYNTTYMDAIEVNYDNFSNDETRDAFYHYQPATNVTGPFSMNVELKRPFAQLNLATTAQDWEWAKTAGVEISHSEVTVEGAVFSTLHTFDGSVTGETKAVFKLNEIPLQGDKLVTDNKEYYYLSTNYLLAPAEKDLSTKIVFTLKDEQVDNSLKEINTLKVYNAPLQRNWRTNIVGDILTGEGTFNITIDQNFTDDRNYDMPGSELVIPVEDAADLYAALDNEDVNIINFKDEVDNVGTGFEIKKDVTLNFNNYELNAGSTATSLWYALEIKGDHNVIINEANFTRAGIFAGEGANVVFNSGLINHKPERTSRYIFCAQSGATITVNAGTFTNDRAKNSYIWADNAVVYVKGGNFGGVVSNKKIVTSNGGQVIISGGTFNFDPTDWLADGYQAVKNGSTWTVSAK